MKTSDLPRQVTMRQAREAIRAEQRKSDLPISKPNIARIAAAQATINEQTSNQASYATKWAAFTQKNVHLQQGDWISKEDYDKLTPDQQQEINQLGIDAYNKKNEQAVKNLNENYIKLDTGEWVSKEDYAKLTPDQQQELKTLGVEKFTAKEKQTYDLLKAEAEQKDADFKASHVQLATGEWVKKSEFDKLPSDQQGILMSGGVIGYQNYMEHPPVRDLPNGITPADYAKLQARTQELRTAYDAAYKVVNEGGKDAFSPESNYMSNLFEMLKSATNLTDYLGKYQNDYRRYELSNPPTKSELDKFILASTPSVAKYTNSFNNQFDMRAARRGELSLANPDSKWVLSALGYRLDQIDKADLLNKLEDVGALDKNGNLDIVKAKTLGGMTDPELKESFGISYDQIWYAEKVAAGEVDGDGRVIIQNSPGYVPAPDLPPIPNYAPGEMGVQVVPQGYQPLPPNPLQVQSVAVQGIITKIPALASPKYNQGFNFNLGQYLRDYGFVNGKADGTKLDKLANELLNAGFEPSQVQKALLSAWGIENYIKTNVGEINVSVDDKGAVTVDDATKVKLDKVYANLAGMGVTPEMFNQAYTNVVTTIGRKQLETEALTKLEPYKQGDGYLLTNYLIDHPNDTKTLYAANFSQDTINKAQMEASHYQMGLGINYDTSRKPEYGSFMNEYFKKQGFSDLDKGLAVLAETHNMDTAVDISGLTSRELNIAYAELTEAQKIALVSGYKQAAAEGERLYDSQYGTTAKVLSQATPFVQFIFQPARAMRPDVRLEDISGAEWALGAGQALALASIPLGGIAGDVGATLARIATAGAGVMFTAYTIGEWDNMTPTQQAVSVITDVLMFSAAFGDKFVNAIRETPLGQDLRTASSKIKAIAKDIYEDERGGFNMWAVDNAPAPRTAPSITQDARGVIKVAEMPVTRAQAEALERQVGDIMRKAADAANKQQAFQEAMRIVEDAAKKSGVSNTQAGEFVRRWMEDLKINAARQAKLASGASRASAFNEQDRLVDLARKMGVGESEINRALLSGTTQSDVLTNMRTLVSSQQAKAPLSGYSAIIPNVNAPVIDYRPFNPLGDLTKLVAATTLSLSPAVATQLQTRYGLSPDNVAGTKPLTEAQALSIAKAAGATQAQIDYARSTNTAVELALRTLATTKNVPTSEVKALAQALAKTLANNSPATASQVIAEVEALANVQENVQTGAEIAVSPQIITDTEAVSEADTAGLTMPDTETEVEPSEQTPATTIPDTQIPNSHYPISPEYYPPDKPPEEGKPPKKPTEEKQEQWQDKEAKREAFKGAITFKHGVGYRAWKYPYRSPQGEGKEDWAFFYREPPPGAIVVPNAKTAGETIQLYLGKTPPPPDKEVRIGFQRVRVSTDPATGHLNIKFREVASMRGKKPKKRRDNEPGLYL